MSSGEEWFTSPGADGPRSHGGRRANTGGARQNAGRKKGGRNRNALYQSALLAAPGIQQQHIAEAQNFRQYMRSGDWRKARIAFECGQEVLEHVWPTPRSAPIQIDLRDTASIQNALADGDITPSDYVGLVRSTSIPMIGSSPESAGGEDARKKFTERLEGIINGRRGPAAASPNGFHNPHSGDGPGADPPPAPPPQPPPPQPPRPRPADSIAELRAKMEAARQAPDGDAIAGLVDDLEALARELEDDNGHRNPE